MLGRTFGRDYKRIREDVETLTGPGRVKRSESGALTAGYDQIRTTIAL